MQTFTGLQYLKIDIANHYGLDRNTWDERLDWVEDHLTNNTLIDQLKDADDEILFAKAVNALQNTEMNRASGHIMGLDATASGYQIMSALIGDYTGATTTNLIDTGNREDIYQSVATEMNKIPGVNVTRKEVKKPCMVVGYGSKAQPAKIFGEDSPELNAFYQALFAKVPGAMSLMDDLMNVRDPWNAIQYSWSLPDGHVVVSKIMAAEHKRLKIKNLGNREVIYNMYVNKPDPYNRSLAANVIHSIDGFIVRQMLRKAKAQNFQLASIHDSFWSHPNYMNQVRQNYVDILADLADNDIMTDIFREITGVPSLQFNRYSQNLGNLIRNANYALS